MEKENKSLSEDFDETLNLGVVYTHKKLKVTNKRIIERLKEEFPHVIFDEFEKCKFYPHLIFNKIFKEEMGDDLI